MTFVYSKEIDEFGWASEQRAQELINEIVSRFANQSQPKMFVGRALWEICTLTQNHDRLIAALKQHNIKLVLFVGDCQRKHPWVELMQDRDVEILFFDFFLYTTYRNLVVSDVAQWNPQADKFLYLTGAVRRERLRTFFKLHQKNLLPKMTWSLFVPNNKDLIDPSWIPEMAPEEVYDFFKQYDGTPDNAETISHPDGTKVIGNSLRYGKDLWRNSRFRLITETSAVYIPGPPTFRITEKTWVTVANKMPFLMLGKPRLLNALRDKNFKTFEEYAKVPDYDTIPDIEERIDALVNNVQSWIIDGMPVDLVQKDIEYNYQHLMTLGQNIEQQLVDFIQKHQLSIELDDLVPTVHNTYILEGKQR